MNANSFPDVVVVTGAGRGIGRALALACANAGSAVLCLSKTDSCHETSKAILGQGGRASSLQVDLADAAAAHQLVTDWIRQQGAVSLGVVAAAAILGPEGPFSTMQLPAWEETLRVNLLGNLAVVHAALPFMLHARYGRIVTLAGGGSAYAYPIFPAYAASKAALVRAVENLSEDLDGKGDIAIVCLAPGAIDTDMLAAVQAAGAEVRTKGDMSKVVGFVEAFMTGNGSAITGRLVHVQDPWAAMLVGTAAPLSASHWKMRRLE